MKTKRRLFLILSLCAPLLAFGCKRKSVEGAAAELVSSFESSDAERQAEIERAGAALRQRQYEQAVANLRQAARRGSLTPGQRQAMNRSVGEVMRALDQDPQRNTPALHWQMQEILLRVNGEN